MKNAIACDDDRFINRQGTKLQKDTFFSLIRFNTICEKRSRTYRYYADLLSSIVTVAALFSEKTGELDNR